MLRISLGSCVEQRGEALVGPTTALIPVLIDIEKLRQDQEKVSKLLEQKMVPQEYKRRYFGVRLLFSKLYRKRKILTKKSNFSYKTISIIRRSEHFEILISLPISTKYC